ncbi:hypothetical protein EKO23_22800 [Nocardioides guangzhouensis]|uniref:Uncharacterized protein n=1 Tax=Nocardioides guangzhouensis TaxID=2497878 RepID=A0A4V1XY40_9ACTN|nr:hypothetical protein [Nocardioides guangzhouensis]RYP81919.1 hypothetical protein EKO23_22800 [Nocardioides guangzhouensis]
MADYRQLLELTEQVPLPVFDDIINLQTRRSRRARAALAVTTVVAVVVTVGALAISGEVDRGQPPPVDRTPTPTPSPTFEVPAGQRSLRADIGPGDVHGFDVLATLTNSQPEHRGATYLEGSATVHTEGIHVSFYCRGSSNLWLMTQRNGGWGFSQCSPDADTSFAPVEDIYQTTPRHLPETLSAAAYVSSPSPDWLTGYDACERHTASNDCFVRWGVPQPIADPPAEFGFRIYEHRSQRRVLKLWNGAEFEALSTSRGRAWVVDRAEFAAPRSDRLAFVLPAAKSRRLLGVFTRPTQHVDTCLKPYQDVLPDWGSHRAEHEAEADRLCGNDVRLLVDGQYIAPPASDDFGTDWGQALMYASPGEHHVVVTVTRGDPRNIRYAVVIRTEKRP